MTAPEPEPKTTLKVFHQGGGNSGTLFCSETSDGLSWGIGEQELDATGGITASPAAVMSAGFISVLHQGRNNNGHLWIDFLGSNPPVDNLVPDVGMSGSPSAVIYKDLLFVFHQGYNNDGQLWYSICKSGAGGLGGFGLPQQVPGAGMTGSPSAIVMGDTILVFYQGYGNNGQLWCSTYDCTLRSWVSNQQVTDVFMSESPSAVIFKLKLYVFHQGYNTSGALYSVASYDGIWGSDSPVLKDMAGMSGSPSGVVFNNSLYFVHQGYRNDGNIWYTRTKDGVKWEPDTQIPNDAGITDSPNCLVTPVKTNISSV